MTCVLNFNMRPWEPFWLPTTTSTSFQMFKPIDEDKENKATKPVQESSIRKRRHSSSDPLNLVVNSSDSCSHDETFDVDAMPPPVKCPRIDDGGIMSSVASVSHLACRCEDHNNNRSNVSNTNTTTNVPVSPSKKENCDNSDGDCRHGKLVVTPSGSGNGANIANSKSETVTVAKNGSPNGSGYADFGDYVDFFRQATASEAEEEDNAVVPCKRPVMPRSPEPGWDDRLIERIQNYRALKHLQLGVIDFRRQYRNGFRYRSRQRAPLRVQLMRYRCMTSLCDKLRHLP